MVVRGDVKVSAGDIFVRQAGPSWIQHRRVIVPHPPRSLRAGVFGVPKRGVELVFGAVHGAGIFADALRDVAVVRAQPGHAAAVGIPGEPDGFHVDHVLGGQNLVAALVKHHARIVAEIDRDVAHIVQPLLPDVGVGIVALVVRRRTDDDEAELVRRVHHGPAWRNVHRPDKIGIGLLHHLEVIIVQPVHRHADARPLHRAAGREALEINRVAIDEQPGRWAEEHLAHAHRILIDIHHRSVSAQNRVNMIEVRKVRIPEMDVGHAAAAGEREFLARGDGLLPR